MKKDESIKKPNMMNKPWGINKNFVKKPWGFNDCSIDFNNPESRLFFLFIRVLFKRGLISIDEINEYLKNYKFINKYINAFFLPEIIKLDPKNVHNILKTSHYSLGDDGNYIENYVSFLCCCLYSYISFS